MIKPIVAGMAVLAVSTTAGVAAEVRVLSAGAVEPGLHKVIEQFQRTTGHTVKVQFNTGPAIAQRLQQPMVADVADVVIAPTQGVQPAKGKSLSDGAHPVVGKVGVGVAVRNDAPVPAIATTDELKASMLAADSIVYNIASTGLYLERLFKRLGIDEQIKPKETRPRSGEEVMKHLVGGKGWEIGFAPTSEIKLFEGRGAKLVGSLPPDIQNYTTYIAALVTDAKEGEAAKAFLAYLATEDSKRTFRDAGIE